MLDTAHPFLGWFSSGLSPPWCPEGGDQGRVMQLNPSVSFPVPAVHQEEKQFVCGTDTREEHGFGWSPCLAF